MFSRHAALAIAVTVLPAILSAQKKKGGPPPLDLSNPDDAVMVQQRIACSTDSTAVTYWWQGTVWSRVTGERDRMLFTFQAMNTRACASFNDPQKGRGYRMVSRELVFYTDPKTGQVLRSWKNPWTGKDTEVMHVSNDPVNMSAPQFARSATGPYQITNIVEKDGTAFMSSIVPLFYTNPLAGDYQENVGGQYHAMELFNFFAPMAELTDRASKTVADVQIHWSRVSRWLPWMNMGDRDGLIIYNSQGKKLKSWDALPDVVKQEIALNYPDYTKPPALDDARPNETSWTYFKKWSAKRARSGN
jgi:hypothetical protein